MVDPSRPGPGPAGHVRVVRLTRAMAERHHAALLALNADSAWENWTREHLLADRPGKWAWSRMLLVDGVPRAFGVCSDREGCFHLHHLVVGAEQRSSGLGRMLMGVLARVGFRAGFRRMTLKVHLSNPSAVRFYLRLGFVVEGDQDGLHRMAGRLGPRGVTP